MNSPLGSGGTGARSSQRGFALITIVLLLALATVSALVVLDVIAADRNDEAESRRLREARAAAEGGLMEVMNDQRVLSILPLPDNPTLSAEYAPEADSAFDQSISGTGRATYRATVEMVRVAPMLESSHELVRAIVYEVGVDAEVGAHATYGVEAEVYRVASASAGVVQGRVHAR